RASFSLVATLPATPSFLTRSLGSPRVQLALIAAAMVVARPSRGGTGSSRKDRLEQIYCREAQKDLLVSKYFDQCKVRRQESATDDASATSHQDKLLVQGSGIEVAPEDEKPEPEDDAVSSYSVSAYTTGTPQQRNGSISARLPTPVIRPGSGAVPAMTPRSSRGATPRGATPRGATPRGATPRGATPSGTSSNAGRALNDAAYASAPAPLDAISERGPTPAASEPRSPGLEWSVLDKIAAELHKQDNQRAKQRDLELKQRLRQDLDKQIADEKLKQDRAKAEEQRYLQLQEEHLNNWHSRIEQRAVERLQKIEATQQERDCQLAIIRARREEEKQQEQQERKALMDSLNRDALLEKQEAEVRMKARRDQVQKAFQETSEAAMKRKELADRQAFQEQQRVEAYEQLRAEREEHRREAAEKEAAQRKAIEKNAGVRAVAMQRQADDVESKAAQERAAKERAMEQQEQANRKKLEAMKCQTQEYLLQQMKEKQLRKAAEAEKARCLAQEKAAEVKNIEAKERERDDFKKRMIREHRSELERQIAARARLKPNKEAMSDCELRLNKQLLEKVQLALTDISSTAGKTC
ncbi:unnamed protein product, partial [Effrenium voratum]